MNKSFKINIDKSKRLFRNIRKDTLSSPKSKKCKSRTHSSPSPQMNYSRSKSGKSRTKSKSLKKKRSRYGSAEERECDMKFSYTPRSPFVKDKI